MDVKELEKAKPLFGVDIIGYVPDSVVYRSILKKPTGNIIVVSLDTGAELAESINPFETYLQIIDGKAVILIDGVL